MKQADLGIHVRWGFSRNHKGYLEVYTVLIPVHHRHPAKDIDTLVKKTTPMLKRAIIKFSELATKGIHKEDEDSQFKFLKPLEFFLVPDTQALALMGRLDFEIQGQLPYQTLDEILTDAKYSID